MLNSADPRSLARARQLTRELRALQVRMNDTVEQLCTLVATHDMGDEAFQLPQHEAMFSPAVLQLPDPTPVRPWVVSGDLIGSGVHVYSDGKGGFMQATQQPLLQRLDASYGLQLQFAEFTGTWLSMVFDVSAMLANMPAGHARLGLSAHLVATPNMSCKARWSWLQDGHKQERQAELHANELSNFQVEIQYFDPSHMSQFELHLIVSPPMRGTLELRRLSAHLSVDEQAAGAVEASVDNVFESAP